MTRRAASASLPLPAGAISYNLARGNGRPLTCPECGAAFSHCVTSSGGKRNVARVKFGCGHEFVRPLAWARVKG